jgi:preprotein translocase subunit SecB
MSDQRAPGYYLVRIFSPELLLSFEEPEEGVSSEENAAVGWDWFAHSTTIFDVILRVEISPTTERRERVSATVVGRFERVGEPERPAFKSFVMQNASAMLAPYLRETVSALTTRGLFGPMLLPPMNVIQMAGRIHFEKSQGYLRALEDAELSAAYDISKPPSIHSPKSFLSKERPKKS